MPRFFNPALLSAAAATTKNLGCVHSSRWQLILFSSLLKQKQLRKLWSWRGSISVWRRCPQNAVIQRTCGLRPILGQRKLPCFALSSKKSVFSMDLWVLEKLHWQNFLGLGPVCTNQALELRLSKQLLFHLVISKHYPVIAWESRTLYP